MRTGKAMLYHSAVCALPALDRQADFLKRLVDRAAITAVFGLDLTGRIQWCGDSAEAMYGYRTSECVGQHAELLWASENSEPKSALERACLTGKWEGEALHARNDGTPLLTQLTLLLRRDASGRPRDVIAMSRDLTPLRRLEEDLATSRAARAALVDTSIAWLLLADPAGVLLRASARTQQFMSPAPSMLSDLFLERQLADALIDETQHAESLEDVELSLRQQTGASVRVRCDTLLIRGQQGPQSSVLVAVRPLPAHETSPRSVIRVAARLRDCEALPRLDLVEANDELCA